MVFGITRSLNESDIIRGSLLRMLTQVDHIYIGDGTSTDGTREEIERLIDDGLPITLFDDTALNFEQRDVMTNYAHMARGHGATFVVPFDIDEVWHADEGTIRERLLELPDTILTVTARLLTHCVTSADDPEDPDPLSSMRWRSVEMLPLPKIACRALPSLHIDHGNHGAWYDGVRDVPAVNGVLAARHFPYRSPGQFIKRVKHAWPMLRDSGLPETHGAHMWAYGRHYEEFGEEGLARWFMNGMYFEDPHSNPDLVCDPAPVWVAVA
jgi:hypothetical protein